MCPTSEDVIPILCMSLSPLPQMHFLPFSDLLSAPGRLFSFNRTTGVLLMVALIYLLHLVRRQQEKIGKVEKKKG